MNKTQEPETRQLYYEIEADILKKMWEHFDIEVEEFRDKHQASILLALRYLERNGYLNVKFRSRNKRSKQ